MTNAKPITVAIIRMRMTSTIIPTVSPAIPAGANPPLAGGITDGVSGVGSMELVGGALGV
jgi:hypothetical protein